MLRTRILAVVPIAILAITAFWFDVRHGAGWGIAVLLAIFSAFASREFYRMTRARGWQPFAKFGIAASVLLVFVHERWSLETLHGAPSLLPGVDLLMAGVTLTVLSCLLLQIFSRGPQGALENVAGTLLGITYIWYLPSFLAKLRHLSLTPHGWQYDGIEFVFICVFVAKVSDVGGLLAGKKFGRRKLCPRLSPGKTWEGTAGGVLLSTLLICTIAYVHPQCAIATLGWPLIIALGMVLSVSALLGDLVESAFKRDSQMKDAGTAVPGFGGVLDLVDSLMLSAPCMYYFLLACGARAGGVS